MPPVSPQGSRTAMITWTVVSSILWLTATIFAIYFYVAANKLDKDLTDIKSKYPDRNDLVAILVDATQRNPLTVMPPFGRNRILNDKEINAIVDFLQTL